MPPNKTSKKCTEAIRFEITAKINIVNKKIGLSKLFFIITLPKY